MKASSIVLVGVCSALASAASVRSAGRSLHKRETYLCNALGVPDCQPVFKKCIDKANDNIVFRELNAIEAWETLRDCAQARGVLTIPVRGKTPDPVST